MLSYSFPGYAINNASDYSFVRFISKNPRDFSICKTKMIKFSNFTNNLRIELCRMMTFALTLTVVSYHVFHIVLMRTEKQMMWIDIKRFIEFVTNNQAFWYWTDKKHVRSVMRKISFFICSESSVAVIYPTSPPPRNTFWRWWPRHIGFKSFLQRQRIIMFISRSLNVSHVQIVSQKLDINTFDHWNSEAN